MKPVNFKEKNITYVAAGCGDLPALKLEKEIISKWKMSLRERFKVLFTGHIWFMAKGNWHPPVGLCLSVDKVFETKKECK